MKIRDKVLYLFLIASGLLGLVAVMSHDTGRYADVYAGGRLYGRYDLAEDRLIHIENDNGIINDIEIADGKIRMKHSTCPGGQCVKTGSICNANESICCAPAGILIVVESAKESKYDAITK